MRVVVMAVGSLGDVAPFTGIADRLSADGYEVALAADKAFTDYITGCGFEFLPLEIDIRAALESWIGVRFTKGRGKVRALRTNLAKMRESSDLLCQSMLEAARGADAVLVPVAAAQPGYLIAKAMGIPSMGIYVSPMTPTGDFPPALFGARSLGRLGNRAVLPMALRAAGPAAGWVKKLQRHLGLPQMSVFAVYQEMEATRWPIRYGYSPAVVPRPLDWRDNVDVVGYWWPREQVRWAPPGELIEFLAAGPPPVLITFGSMAHGSGEWLTDVVVSALRSAGVRGVIQAGWAGLSAASDDVLLVGEVAHEWLLPRVAAVVHHAGAGTAGASLRAGVPAIPVPVGFDHAFWAARLVRVGVSPGALPLRKLTAERLGELIVRAVTEPTYRKTARALAEKIAVEDGAGRVAADLQELMQK